MIEWVQMPLVKWAWISHHLHRRRRCCRRSNVCECVFICVCSTKFYHGISATNFYIRSNNRLFSIRVISFYFTSNGKTKPNFELAKMKTNENCEYDHKFQWAILEMANHSTYFHFSCKWNRSTDFMPTNSRIHAMKSMLFFFQTRFLWIESFFVGNF